MAYPYLQDILKDLFCIDIWLPLPTFGAWVVIALLAVLWIFHKEVKRMETAGLLPTGGIGKPLSQQAINLWALTMIAGMLGARIFAVAEDCQDLLRNPGHTLFRGGLAILGGFIAGGLAALVWLKRKGFLTLSVFDASAPAVFLGFALGRIGCQLSGDGDWGIPADMGLKPDWLPTWFWAQTYQHNVIGQVIPPPGVYPTSVYESLLAFLTFLILWRFRAHKYAPGWTFSLLLVLGGLQRFLIEEIRVNIRYSVLGLELTQAQIIVSICVILGVLGLAITSRRPRLSSGSPTPT